MIKTVLASNNLHKAEEFLQIFNDEKIEISILMPADLYLTGLDVEETGVTFEENALIKAKAFFEAAGMPAISDDSGLEIDALELRPGVYSARYSGENANDKSNRIKVLDELSAVPANERTARFRSVICYFDGEITLFGVGKVEGRIINEERGEGGFGYDSIFVPDGYTQTFAEISQKDKNSISHRKNAIMDFIEKYKKG
jgi:XTP/dITP diphosphohydrolase